MDLYLACAALVAAWGVRWLLAAPRRALTVAVRQGPALRAANALLWLPCALRDRFGVRVPRVGFMLGRPLSLAALMAAAERRTGLHDWGASASFPALFGLAVDRLNEARPSPVGRLVAFDYLMRRLEVRLRVVAAARSLPRRPEMSRAPVFVVGLPRTGTTLLHHLLACDPAAQCLRCADIDTIARRPVQPLATPPAARAARAALDQIAIGLGMAVSSRVLPHYEHHHALSPANPEECLFALQRDLPLDWGPEHALLGAYERDGEIVQRLQAKVAAGEDVLTFPEPAGTSGLHRYDVEITAKDERLDETADDNTASAFVRVRGPARALVIDGNADATGFMTAALEAAGFRVEGGGLSSLPAGVGGMANYDLIVFGDIPAHDLRVSQIEGLASYARDLGGGLVLTGGDASFGPGGYARTALEDVSPVSFDLKQEKRRASLAEVIAIDISGSMGAQVGGQTKLELANEAAYRSADLLGGGDQLGV